MKVLIAIDGSVEPKTLAETTLRWAGRTGFNTRVFIASPTNLAAYEEAVEAANHNWYLNLPKTVIVVETTPLEFAKAEGFDAIVYLPGNMRKWDPNSNHELNPLRFASSVGDGRVALGKDPLQDVYEFANGVTMERVK